MSASYPSSAKTFTPLVDNVDYPQVAQVNAVYDEIAAVEAALLTGGLAHTLVPDSSGAARTLGSSAKFWGLSYLKGINLAAATTLTIATGVVTAAQGFHAVDTEAAAGTDDLDTITAGAGLVEGAMLVLRAANVAHVVTVKDGTGNLLLNGDCALSATDKTITLIYDGTNWRELARSGTGSGKPFLMFGTLSNQPPSSSYATPDSRNAHPILAFDKDSAENAVFGGVLPVSYGSGGLTVDIYWAAAPSATSGNVKWNAAIERGQTGTDSLDADSFAAVQTTTSACNGTNGRITKTTIIFTDGAQMDSLAAGEPFRLKVTRDAADGGDTMTVDAQLWRVVVRET